MLSSKTEPDTTISFFKVIDFTPPDFTPDKGISFDLNINPYKIISAYVINYKESLGLKTKLEIINIKLTDIPIADKKSTGSTISKQDIIESFEITKLIKKENKKEIEKENISLESIDNKIISIDDLLEDIENNQK